MRTSIFHLDCDSEGEVIPDSNLNFWQETSPAT